MWAIEMREIKEDADIQLCSFNFKSLDQCKRWAYKVKPTLPEWGYFMIYSPLERPFLQSENPAGWRIKWLDVYEPIQISNLMAEMSICTIKSKVFDIK